MPVLLTSALKAQRPYSFTHTQHATVATRPVIESSLHCTQLECEYVHMRACLYRPPRLHNFSISTRTLCGLLERAGRLIFLHKSSLHLVSKTPVKMLGRPGTLPPLLSANRLTRYENHSFREKPITSLARSSHLQGLSLNWQSRYTADHSRPRTNSTECLTY